MQYSLPLFVDESVRRSQLSMPSGYGDSVVRQWLDPTVFDEIVGVDAGLGKIHFHMLYKSHSFSLPVEAAAARMAYFPANTLIVGESAHLSVPQTQRSLSQPFSADQLLSLYSRLREKDITLMIFPHQHSGPRAREWVAHNFPGVVESSKGSDLNDAKSLAYYVRHCNGISLAKPPRSFAKCARRNYGRRVIDLSNIALNAERSRGYKGTMFPSVVSLGRAIKKKSHSTCIDLRVAISIASTIVTEKDGKAFLITRRSRPVGGWFWMRHVISMSPFHHRGGIARSNIMRHRFRSFLAAYGKKHGVCLKTGSKYVKFGHYTQKQKQVHSDALRELRRSLLRAYRIGVQLALESGYELHELGN